MCFHAFKIGVLYHIEPWWIYPLILEAIGFNKSIPAMAMVSGQGLVMVYACRLIYIYIYI